MRFVNILSAALLGLMAVVPQQLAAQQSVANPDGIWRHQGSGAIFPRFIGSAERNSITEFNAEGTDASAGYSLNNDSGVLILTIYVYPTLDNLTCRQNFDDSKRAIDQYDGVDMRDEGMLPNPSGRTDQVAYHARYFIPAGAVRPDYPALWSDLYLHCPKNSGWLVKYRASWTGTKEDFPDIPKLLRQVEWGSGLE